MTPPERCVKCGYEPGAETYDPAGAGAFRATYQSGMVRRLDAGNKPVEVRIEPEHLSWSCRACGYSYTTPCEDAT